MIQVSGASADCGVNEEISSADCEVNEEISSADCRVVWQKPLKDTY